MSEVEKKESRRTPQKGAKRPSANDRAPRKQSRRRSHSGGFKSSAPTEPTLSLIVPVYNEAQHLRRWCDAVLDFDFGMSTEFVFVDDASTDASAAILEEYRTRRDDIVLLTQPNNRGKGMALSRGIAASRGTFVVIQDADFEYAFADIPVLVQLLIDDEADVVFGSRYKNSVTVHRTFHYAVNRLLTSFSNLLSGLYVTDMETCYKAFRGEIIRNIVIESPRFGFEPEITAKIASLDVRVAEVPIRYHPRNYVAGKKIRWTDGVAALWHIARFNLDRRARMRALQNVPARYRVSGRRWL